jgi:DNA-binding protein H-NS
MESSRNLTSSDFTSMSSDQLWELYQEVSAKLADMILVEKAELEERLRKIQSTNNVIMLDRPRERRPYPKVHAKYQNPKNPAETWSGRGKQPRWLAAELRAGEQLDNFLIANPLARNRQRIG